MPDLRFHHRCGPFALAELAAAVGAELPDGADPGRRFADVAGFADAGSDAVTYLEQPRYAANGTAAGLVLVRPENAALLPSASLALRVGHPAKSFARVAAMFYPGEVPPGGVDKAAVVDPAAQVGHGTRIEPGAVIGPRAVIGAGCHVQANAVLGEGVVLGDACRIGMGAGITHAVLGARVVVGPGTRIGQQGFGFVSDATGHQRVPQLGRVVIGDAVEIGASTCIDRGAMGDTVIGLGTIIDNLVHIAHNVRIGRFCVILAQVGIAGSAEIEDFVVIAGQAGLSGHIKVGKAARIAARAGVFRNVEPGSDLAGFPAVPVRQWHRQSVAVSRLAARKSE